MQYVYEHLLRVHVYSLAAPLAMDRRGTYLQPRATGGAVVYPDDVDESGLLEDGFRGASNASAASQTSPFGAFWWLCVLACIGFAVVAGSLSLNYIYNSSYNGGDQGQWRNIDLLNVNVSSIWTFLQQQFQCMSCSGGQLTVQDTLFVNGSLMVVNQSGGAPVDVVPTLEYIMSVVNNLTAQITQLEQWIALNNRTAIRLEVLNFETIFAAVPVTQFIPFTDTGFYGYVRDPMNLFDTSNDNYTVVNRDAIIQASVQVYFSANITESYVVCFFMPFTNSTPGAEPTLMSGIGEAANITAFGGFSYAGVVTMISTFSAKAGWELNTRCTISQGEPLDFVVTSHMDLVEIV